MDRLAAEDQEHFNAAKGLVIVGNGGLVKPGCIDYNVALPDGDLAGTDPGCPGLPRTSVMW